MQLFLKRLKIKDVVNQFMVAMNTFASEITLTIIYGSNYIQIKTSLMLRGFRKGLMICIYPLSPGVRIMAGLGDRGWMP
jgi:hypothetical protein